ncbi:TatD family hydrolase [Janibacter indicus]|uniref:AraC family transcriptional regulator n=1 Tax=Janibacter indicus TaxID=857417 RepID=A0A1L3MIH9_9MICO|nr:TatD family hydrolase [Janibacter indicus]APH02225.1 AraC family transcriptional regulator [Janibacter indicus]QOK22164.1 TatD family hydrolase [Janibacter indicus]
MGDREGVAPHPDPLPVAVVDNHTHLDIRRRDVADAIAPEGGDERTTQDVAAALATAASVGVDRVVQVGCDLESARFTVDQVDRHPTMLGAVALHPNEIPALAEAGRLQEAWDEIEQLAAHPRVRAIGETGLDYFRTGPDGHAVQQESFRWHIDLAKRTGKALQIHDRDSHDDILRILAEEGAPETTVLHCFSGDLAMARECVQRGYHLSFAGTVTFKSAAGLREALAHTPLEQVLAETDAPYLTPTPERGRANAPYLLPHTVRVMARTLGVDVPTMCSAISANSERVYGSWQTS